MRAVNDAIYIVIGVIILEAFIASINFSSAILTTIMPFVPVVLGIGAFYAVSKKK